MAEENIMESSWQPERDFIRWSMRDSGRLSHAQFRVMLSIMTRMNISTGISFPSRKTIAEDSGVNIKTVDSSIAIAKNLGLLHVESGGFSKANQYSVGNELKKFHWESINPPVRDASMSPVSGASCSPMSGEGMVPLTGDLTYKDNVQIRTKDKPQPPTIPQPTLFEPEPNSSDREEIDELLAPGSGVPIAVVPWLKIFDLYNEMAKNLGIPKLSLLTASRKSHAKARIKEHGLENFLKVLLMPIHSEFLAGKTPASGGYKVFRATFDWLMNPNNFVKVLEGKYTDEKEVEEIEKHHAL